MEPELKKWVAVLQNEAEKVGKVIADVSKCDNEQQMAQMGAELLKNVGDSVSRCVQLVDTDNLSSVIEEVRKARAASVPPVSSVPPVPSETKQEKENVNAQKSEEKKEDNAFKIGEVVSLFSNFFENNGGFDFAKALNQSHAKLMVTQYKLLESTLEDMKEKVKNLPEKERTEFWCEYHGIKLQPTPQEERLNNIENVLKDLVSKISK